jgi:hypothetical protein
MPHFVILHHRLPPDLVRADHYDLMLEDGVTELLTWALPELPSGAAQQAEQLPPHRRDYLTYEGPISNNRGEVTRVAAGKFEWCERTELELIVQLSSEKLSGRLHLLRREGAEWLVWLSPADLSER